MRGEHHATRCRAGVSAEGEAFSRALQACVSARGRALHVLSRYVLCAPAALQAEQDVHSRLAGASCQLLKRRQSARIACIQVASRQQASHCVFGHRRLSLLPGQHDLSPRLGPARSPLPISVSENVALAQSFLLQASAHTTGKLDLLSTRSQYRSVRDFLRCSSSVPSSACASIPPDPIVTVSSSARLRPRIESTRDRGGCSSYF